MKRGAWIAAGYAGSAVMGFAAVALKNSRISPADQNAMSGMMAAGDLIAFVLVAGLFALIPTIFLIRWFGERFSRTIPWALLAMAATAAPSWWVMAHPHLPVPPALRGLFGVALIGWFFPRVAASPVLLALDGVLLVLGRDGRTRAILLIALALEGLPLSLFALHLARGFLR